MTPRADVSFRCRGPAVFQALPWAEQPCPHRECASHGDTGLSKTDSYGPWHGRWRRVFRPRLRDT